MLGANGHPTRPYVGLVMDEHTAIRAAAFQEDEFTNSGMQLVLVESMLVPAPNLIDGACRPQTILIDDPFLVDSFAEVFQDIDVEIGYSANTAELDDLAADLQDHLDQSLQSGVEALTVKPDALPVENDSLLDIPGITNAQLKSFYLAAQLFALAEPWYVLNGDEVIAISMPDEHGSARYASILGSGGEAFGITLYESLDMLRQQIDPERLPNVTDEAGIEAHMDRVKSLSVIYSEPQYMHADDLIFIEDHEVQVVDIESYPLVLKPQNGALAPLTVDDIRWLTVTMLAFNGMYMEDDFDIQFDAYESIVGLEAAFGKTDYYLQFPVPWRIADVTSPFKYSDSLTQLILNRWAASSDYALHNKTALIWAKFLLAFEESLVDLSSKTIDSHLKNAYIIGFFAQLNSDDEQAILPEMMDVEPQFLAQFRLSSTGSKSAEDRYKRTWRKLAKFAQTL